MYLKSSEIYIIVGTIAIIVVFFAFCPIEIVTINNQTMFNTFFNLKFEDGALSNMLWVVVLGCDFFVQDITFVPSYCHVS